MSTWESSRSEHGIQEHLPHRSVDGAATRGLVGEQVIIQHAGGQAEAKLNQRIMAAVEGVFQSQGHYDFTPEQPAVVTIRTSSTDGFVSIDTIQLVEAE